MILNNAKDLNDVRVPPGNRLEALSGEVCRKLGTSEQTYYRWRKEYGGLRVNHLKRLKALELENRRLRTVVADQALALVIQSETTMQKTD